MDRNLSFLLTLTLSLGGSAHAQLARADIEVPRWEKAFGKVSPEEMTRSTYSTFKEDVLRAGHANLKEYEAIAMIWRFNGTLPLRGTGGYFLLSHRAADDISAGCLNELLGDLFCIVNYQAVQTIHEHPRLNEVEQEHPLNETRRALKLLSPGQTNQLYNELIAFEHDLDNYLRPDGLVPPAHYDRLGMLRGYAQGLDPHTLLLTSTELEEKLKVNLRVKRVGTVLTIGFDVFSLDLASVISKILKSQFKKGDRLLFDLRNNPGGHASASVNLAKMFLNDSYVKKTNGDLLFRTRIRYSDVDEDPGVITTVPFVFRDEETLKFPETPIAILVNEGSCSASEIFTSLLQQQGRALVIGSRTCGKGTVQFAETFAKGRFTLVYTAGFFSIPSGVSPQLVGIEPDVVVASKNKKAVLLEQDLPLALQPLPINAFNADHASLSSSILNCAARLQQELSRHFPSADDMSKELGVAALSECFATENRP